MQVNAITISKLYTQDLQDKNFGRLNPP